MIRATAATWLNYGTTLAMQVLFASSFGTSSAAGAFVICFSACVAVAGVLITTGTTVLLPRLVTTTGSLDREAARYLAAIGICVLVGGLLVAVLSPLLAGAVSAASDIDEETATQLILRAAGLLVILGIAGLVGVISLALGQRFVPAIAPAAPSTAAILYLAVVRDPTALGTMTAMSVGGLVQIGILVIAVLAAEPHMVSASRVRVTAAALQMVSVLVLLATVAPIQRILSGAVEASGVAQIDYAVRSMQAAQQLLIGGLLIAILPDWAAITNQRQLFHGRVAAVLSVAALTLFAAGAIALVAAPELVSIAFERGAFTSADVTAVAGAVRVMSPGFIAEGLTLILVQALFADGHWSFVARAGIVRVATQIFLMAILASWLGMIGVALAYSVAMVVVLLVTIGGSRAVLNRRHFPSLARATLAGSLTLGAGAGAVVLGEAMPVAASVVLVSLVCVSGAWLICGRDLVRQVRLARAGDH